MGECIDVMCEDCEPIWRKGVHFGLCFRNRSNMYTKYHCIVTMVMSLWNIILMPDAKDIDRIYSKADNAMMAKLFAHADPDRFYEFTCEYYRPRGELRQLSMTHANADIT